MNCNENHQKEDRVTLASAKMFKKLALLALLVPGIAQAQLSGSGCWTGSVGFQTCATYSLAGSAGSYSLTISNDHSLNTRKFGDILIFYTGTMPSSGNPVSVSSPLGWSDNESGFNGNVWYLGAQAKYDNFALQGPFLQGGSSVTINFSASTALTLVGVGVHAQEGPNGNSQWIRFDGNTTTVPEPSTYALMGAGLLGLFSVARRRRSAQV